MILRKIFITGISLLSALFVFAQQPKEVIDAKAKAILDEVAAKTKTYPSVQADFVSVTEKQVSNTESKTTETQSGKLQLKGEKYRLEIKGQVIFCDGKTQWTYIKESNEVQVNNAPDPKTTDNITLTNIFTIYEKGYKYKYEKEDVLNGIKVDIVDLFPLAPDKKTFHTVKLSIDKLKKTIVSLKMLNKNGTSNTITVNHLITNSEIPDSAFTFNKADYKGVEVVDLRDN